jgi:hypothetical protein
VFGSRIRLVGVLISFEKNFYRLPFTPPLSGSPYRSFRSELEEMRLKAYENVSIYKERIKRWYDKRLKKKEFKEGDKVLLFNSRFKTFRKGKLQNKWDGPYIVHSVLSNGAVTIMDVKGDQFMVNGQGLKVYYETDIILFTVLMSSPWRKSLNVKPRT